MLNTLITEMKSAMKSGDKIRLQTLRNMISAFKALKIETGKDLTDNEAIKLFQNMAKKLKDSINQYQKGNRPDLAENEQKELNILETFLPDQMTEKQLRKIVNDTIIETGAKSIADIRKVMPLLMPKIAGKADGKLASNIVKEELNS